MSETIVPSVPCPISAFFAHTVPDRPTSEWERLEDHLDCVAQTAGRFADQLNSREWGYTAGLWHDIGKFSAEFQAYLHHENGFEAHLEQYVGRVDHSTAGAQHAAQCLGPTGRIHAYCIAGHHAGLADAAAESATSSLENRLAKDIPDYSAAPAELLAKPDLPNPPLTLTHGDPQRAAFQLALFTRMLFSCLVDADFLATEEFMSRDRSRLRPSDNNRLSAMQAALDAHLDSLPQSPSVVGQARREVLSACRNAAEQSPGLFSLTVPTGGGKTLSSLAFALRHANRHGLRRVIYAIPFTSIIEQTAGVFRDVLRDMPDVVLEHHSSVDPEQESVQSRLAAENWDAPLVVTTNVQLFESLYAARTSRCRKLHNIAGGVIVLDEVQTIPVELLEPTLAVIRELVADYGCSIVLCTATQPAIVRSDGFDIGLDGVREIVPEPAELYERLKRVRVCSLGRTTDDKLVEQLQPHSQFLCIVNTRPHASRLFDRIRESASSDNGVFHLSTFMCGQHRADVLDTIRHRLKDGRPCRVISTQLIESGVDVDFPVVFRALTGIDSIAQAAGRCNREGTRETGDVFVFEPTDVRLRGYLRTTAETTSELIAGIDADDLDLLELEIVQRYFELHYARHCGGQRRKGDGWDSRDVMPCFPAPPSKLHFNFRTAAERFRWIDDATETVFVPYEGGAELIEQLRDDGPSRTLMRRLQRYSVGLYERVFNSMIGADIEHLDSGYAVLVNESCYDNDTGFRFDIAGFHEPETLII